jgi:hypothetical protein
MARDGSGGHSQELMDECAKLLQGAYPPEHGYRYIFDKRLPGSFLRPDIQIVYGESVCCVVEIGQMKAEKWIQYRGLGMRERRWYTKNLELAMIERARYADAMDVHLALDDLTPEVVQQLQAMGWMPE